MKEFSVFDIIGPRMVGPSSSHTAGAVRIGLIAHRLIGSEHIKSADITLYGSFAETGLGHGTDRAILAGILGIGTEDPRIRYSVLLAQSEGVKYAFHKSDREMNHPNTAMIIVESVSGRKFEIIGTSVGGGNIEIVEINGMEVSFTGDYPALVIFYQDVPGVISTVTAILARTGANVAFMKVFRSAKRMDACMVIETDADVPEEDVELIRQSVNGIKEICKV